MLLLGPYLNVQIKQVLSNYTAYHNLPHINNDTYCCSLREYFFKSSVSPLSPKCFLNVIILSWQAACLRAVTNREAGYLCRSSMHHSALHLAAPIPSDGASRHEKRLHNAITCRHHGSDPLLLPALHAPHIPVLHNKCDSGPPIICRGCVSNLMLILLLSDVHAIIACAPCLYVGGRSFRLCAAWVLLMH